MKVWNKQKAAVIFDFDKTLCPYYMQRPIFDDLGISEMEFWKKTAEDSKIKTGDFLHELIYLNSFLELNRTLPNSKKITKEYLNNVGSRIQFFQGVISLFKQLSLIDNLEIYIISSGLKEVIEGTPISKYCKHIYGCSFNYDHNGICSVENIVSAREKACIIDSISRGTNILGFDYYPSLFEKDNDLRIPFNRMIYFGDGVTDIPAFNILSKNGGISIGVYDPKIPEQLVSLDLIALDGRLSHIREADYTEGSRLYNTIMFHVNNIVVGLEDYSFSSFQLWTYPGTLLR